MPPRSSRPELLDERTPDLAALRATLADLRLTNRWLGGRRALLGALEPLLLARDRPLEVLDVGTGGADLPRALARRARRLRREVLVTAIDREPLVAALAARGRGRPTGDLRVLCADARRLPFADRSFDVVTASLFLHHFEHRDIVELLRSFLRLARGAVVVNDLRRHLVPWLFIWIASRATRRHPIYVHDAPLSVLRGFTGEELAAAAREAGASSFTLRRRLPYRLVLTLQVDGATA